MNKLEKFLYALSIIVFLVLMHGEYKSIKLDSEIEKEIKKIDERLNKLELESLPFESANALRNF
ncbi:hypothetical protein A3K86_22125 [Photobacterium jeanii]|uniref:Uncharacterized protein n=1 Tax=Photobacterium jeanii TaxID=858640 RepID=A0A178K3U3_9GAMM|nr:hypothetical protein [Photobacterium jeanii]OAN11615.1 hypothetical protein A3K86_22125 [Photobacterium jeanii]PST91136.1 hypothetical protein C9I91_11230 [Photobacterium jeanii]